MDDFLFSYDKFPSSRISFSSIQLQAASPIMPYLLTFVTSSTSCCYCGSLVSHRCWCRCWNSTLLSKVSLPATIATYPIGTIVMIPILITLWTTSCILLRGGSLGCYCCNNIRFNHFTLLLWWLPSPSLWISSNLPFITPRLWKINLLLHVATMSFLVR